MPPSLKTRIVAAVVVVLAASLTARAGGLILDEQFDSPNPTWRVRPATGVQVLAQLRTQAPDAHRPTTAERVVLACAAGYAVQVAHQVGPLPVLDEVAIDVVVRANRPSVQLAAEVVFPRSRDPATGEPLRALVHGHRYSQPGQWQQLRLDRVPLLATRQARLLSVDPKRQVDVREAYVDEVVLVVPGGSGESLLEVDQLRVVGVANEPTTANTTESATDNMDGPLLQAPGLATTRRTETFEPVEIRRRGDTLSIAGVAFVPRTLEYRGESFDLVAELGFNAVWMRDPPSEAQLRAARAARLWVIGPPPPPDRLAKVARDSIWQTVLAWSLGLDHNAAALDTIASTVEDIRRADALQRPVLVGVSDRARRFGQFADIVVQQRRLPREGELPPTVENAPAVLGCSPWTQLSLGWSPEATRQAQLLAPRQVTSGGTTPHGSATRCSKRWPKAREAWSYVRPSGSAARRPRHASWPINCDC